MADLKSRKWAQTKAEIEFKPEFLKSHYNIPVFKSTDSSYHLGENTAKICIRCKEIFPLEECPNCGSDQFIPGITTDRVAGLFCFKCEKGQSSWSCPSCQTDNPINKSLAIETGGGGCFIATAVYGSYDSPEVVVLRNFRDVTLLKSQIGKSFVKFYYAISPPLAALLSKTSTISSIIKFVLLQPLVHFLKYRQIDK